MQLPIHSLNGVHVEEYLHGLDPVFSYYLNEEELDDIKIISESSKIQALLNIPALYEEEKKVEDSDAEMGEYED